MNVNFHADHQTVARAEHFSFFTTLVIERPGHGEISIYMPPGDAAERLAAEFNAAMGTEPAAIREPEPLVDAVTDAAATEAAE